MERPTHTQTNYTHTPKHKLTNHTEARLCPHEVCTWPGSDLNRISSSSCIFWHLGHVSFGSGPYLPCQVPAVQQHLFPARPRRVTSDVEKIVEFAMTRPIFDMLNTCEKAASACCRTTSLPWQKRNICHFQLCGCSYVRNRVPALQEHLLLQHDRNVLLKIQKQLS